MRLPNTYGGVVKLGGKRRKPYAARLTVGWTNEGKQIYKYIGYFERKTDALQALADYHKAPYDLSNINITFAEIYDQWATQRFPFLSKSALNNYRGAYKHCSAIHDTPMKQIKTAQLQAIFDNSPLALETLKHVKSFLKQIFAYAIENDIITKDYSAFVRLNKAPSAPVRSVFTDNEINTLWDKKHVLHADTALIMIYTGLRIGELLDITADNVHLEDRYMVGGKKTKAGTDRIIPIHEKIVPLIANRLERGGKYLILSAQGKKLQYTYFSSKYWADLMQTLKMSHTPHDCRATFASLIDRTDANKTAIKRILGHANGDITEHYTHKNILDLVEAVNKI